MSFSTPDQSITRDHQVQFISNAIRQPLNQAKIDAKD